jgi:Fe-S cluster assembly protein SufD
MAVAEKISATDKLIQLVERSLPALAGSTFLKQTRQKAFESFIKQGLPGKKNEEYKYSNPDKLFGNDFILGVQKPGISGISIEKYVIRDLDANIAVLVNGRYSTVLSALNNLPKGAIVSSLAEAFEKNKDIVESHFARYADVNTDPFIALNTALASDGIFVFLPDNVVLNFPLHIINLITSKEAALFSTRNLLVIGKNASISVIESFETVELNVAVITNTLTEITLGENARGQYYKLQNECGNGNQVNTMQVYQEGNSHFDTNTVTLNGSWIRNNLNIVEGGKNCETHLNGLYILNGTQHLDNHTLVDHQVPHCQSNQLYKGILDDKSTGVFNGKIFVRKDAQKTNAYQSSKNILLSDNATINTKPQLEIYADDVKCSHGSSTGQIDPDAMFYLRSRGLSEDSSRRLLMHAFAADVLNTIRIDALKNYLDELVTERLIK